MTETKPQPLNENYHFLYPSRKNWIVQYQLIDFLIIPLAKVKPNLRVEEVLPIVNFLKDREALVTVARYVRISIIFVILKNINQLTLILSFIKDYGLDESGDNTDEDSSSKHISQDTSSRSPNDLTSKQSNLSSYSSSSSISSLKGKQHIETTHTTTIRQHSTISSQVRAMTEQSWPQTQKSMCVLSLYYRYVYIPYMCHRFLVISK